MLRRTFLGLVLTTLTLLLSAGVAAQDKAPTAPPKVAPAQELRWLDFTPGAFQRALAEDRLILLVLEMPWSDLCAKAQAEVWRDPAVVQAVRAGYVPIRVRADLRPDLVRRYPAEGWPAVSVLLSDGSAMFVPVKDAEPRRVSTGFRPADQMAGFLKEAAGRFHADSAGVAKLAREREQLIQKTSRPEHNPVNVALLWTMAEDLRATFDPERRYFGGPPRIPRFELIELMFDLAAERSEPWRTMGIASLETLTAKLADPADGALRRAAMGLDWEDVQAEKLLDRSARYLDLLTLAWRTSGKKTDRERVLKTAGFIAEKLSLKNGAFASALAAAAPGGRDETILSGPTGLAAAALIRAGAAAGDPALLHRGLMAAVFLKDQRRRPGGLAPRAVVGDEAILPDNLDDQVQVSWAFLAAYEATGDRSWLDAARDLADTTLNNLIDRGVGALMDMVPKPRAVLPLRRPLYPQAANADFVRVAVRLWYLTEERKFQQAAEAILQAYAKPQGGLSMASPSYGLALYEYFLPPMNVAVMGRAADERSGAFRLAAMGAAYPFVVVRSFDPDKDQDAAKKLSLPFSKTPTAIGLHAGKYSQPQKNPDALRGVLAALRDDHLAEVRAREAQPTPTPPPPRRSPGR